MSALDVYIYDLVNSKVVGQMVVDRRQGLRFTREYPGGLAGRECTFFVAKDIVQAWDIQLHNRLTVFNGLNLVWEGEITDFTNLVSQGQQGTSITARGYWHVHFENKRWRKWWADARISDAVWDYVADIATATATEYCTHDRQERLRFTPKAVSWTTDNASFKYVPPTGTYVERIEFDYDLTTPDANQWDLSVKDQTNDVTEWSVSRTSAGSSTGSQAFDLTNGGSCVDLRIHFFNTGTFTPPADGTTYGELTNVVVFSTYETGHAGAEGTFDIAEMGEEVVEYLSNTAANYFSGDKTGIDTSLTYSLIPFISENDTLARILERAAEFGDSSNARVAAAVDLSSTATDAHPRLIVENTAALTDYDYQIDYDAPQLAGRLNLEYSLDELANYVIVEYVDEQGFRQVVTPDDDASLTDSDSVTDWGQREYVLRLGQVTQAQAIHLGETYMTRHRKPEWTMRPVRVRGYLEKKDGSRLPAAEIEPGKRIKVSSYLDDGSGTWLIFLITRVQYDEESQVATITTNNYDRTDPLMQRLRAGLEL